MLNDDQQARLAALAALRRPLTDDELDELAEIVDDLTSDDRRTETVRVVGDIL